MSSQMRLSPPSSKRFQSMQASNLEIIKLNNLKLAAKIISEQLKNGIHLGKRVGVGSEFEQYRYYEPGDDPKRIDWKYFSRSGKYMVKESQTESHLSVRMMLDLSGSMNYEENGIKRLEYAKKPPCFACLPSASTGRFLELLYLSGWDSRTKGGCLPKSISTDTVLSAGRNSIRLLAY